MGGKAVNVIDYRYSVLAVPVSRTVYIFWHVLYLHSKPKAPAGNTCQSVMMTSFFIYLGVKNTTTPSGLYEMCFFYLFFFSKLTSCEKQ